MFATGRNRTRSQAGLHVDLLGLGWRRQATQPTNSALPFSFSQPFWIPRQLIAISSTASLPGASPYIDNLRSTVGPQCHSFSSIHYRSYATTSAEILVPQPVDEVGQVCPVSATDTQGRASDLTDHTLPDWVLALDALDYYLAWVRQMQPDVKVSKHTDGSSPLPKSSIDDGAHLYGLVIRRSTTCPDRSSSILPEWSKLQIRQTAVRVATQVNRFLSRAQQKNSRSEIPILEDNFSSSTECFSLTAAHAHSLYTQSKALKKTLSNVPFTHLFQLQVSLDLVAAPVDAILADVLSPAGTAGSAPTGYSVSPVSAANDTFDVISSASPPQGPGDKHIVSLSSAEANSIRNRVTSLIDKSNRRSDMQLDSANWEQSLVMLRDIKVWLAVQRLKVSGAEDIESEVSQISTTADAALLQLQNQATTHVVAGTLTETCRSGINLLLKDLGREIDLNLSLTKSYTEYKSKLPGRKLRSESQANLLINSLRTPGTRAWSFYVNVARNRATTALQDRDNLEIIPASCLGPLVHKLDVVEASVIQIIDASSHAERTPAVKHNPRKTDNRTTNTEPLRNASSKNAKRVSPKIPSPALPKPVAGKSPDHPPMVVKASESPVVIVNASKSKPDMIPITPQAATGQDPSLLQKPVETVSWLESESEEAGAADWHRAFDILCDYSIFLSLQSLPREHDSQVSSQIATVLQEAARSRNELFQRIGRSKTNPDGFKSRIEGTITLEDVRRIKSIGYLFVLDFEHTVGPPTHRVSASRRLTDRRLAENFIKQLAEISVSKLPSWPSKHGVHQAATYARLRARLALTQRTEIHRLPSDVLDRLAKRMSESQTEIHRILEKYQLTSSPGPSESFEAGASSQVMGNENISQDSPSSIQPPNSPSENIKRPNPPTSSASRSTAKPAISSKTGAQSVACVEDSLANDSEHFPTKRTAQSDAMTDKGPRPFVPPQRSDSDIQNGAKGHASQYHAQADQSTVDAKEGESAPEIKRYKLKKAQEEERRKIAEENLVNSKIFSHHVNRTALERQQAEDKRREKEAYLARAEHRAFLKKSKIQLQPSADSAIVFLQPEAAPVIRRKVVRSQQKATKELADLAPVVQVPATMGPEAKSQKPDIPQIKALSTPHTPARRNFLWRLLSDSWKRLTSSGSFWKYCTGAWKSRSRQRLKTRVRDPRASGAMQTAESALETAKEAANEASHADEARDVDRGVEIRADGSEMHRGFRNELAIRYRNAIFSVDLDDTTQEELEMKRWLNRDGVNDLVIARLLNKHRMPKTLREQARGFHEEWTKRHDSNSLQVFLDGSFSTPNGILGNPSACRAGAGCAIPSVNKTFCAPLPTAIQNAGDAEIAAMIFAIKMAHRQLTEDLVSGRKFNTLVMFITDSVNTLEIIREPDPRMRKNRFVIAQTQQPESLAEGLGRLVRQDLLKLQENFSVKVTVSWLPREANTHADAMAAAGRRAVAEL